MCVKWQFSNAYQIIEFSSLEQRTERQAYLLTAEEYLGNGDENEQRFPIFSCCVLVVGIGGLESASLQIVGYWTFFYTVQCMVTF